MPIVQCCFPFHSHLNPLLFFILVVGGECSKPLGTSAINVKIEGCDWHGDTYEYSGSQRVYNNVPSTLVKVQVTSNEYPHIESYFQNGDSPRIESIDLTDEHILEDEIEKRENTEVVDADEPSLAPSSAPSTTLSGINLEAEAKNAGGTGFAARCSQ